MKNRRSSFPLIVGLVTDRLLASTPAAQGVRDVLRQLRERSPAGVLVVSPVRDEELGAEEAGIRWETFPQDASESAQMELVEASDLVLIISSGADDNSPSSHLVAFAHNLGRPVVRIDENNVLLDEVPPRIETETGWLADLFELAGLSPNDSLETIQARMDGLANKAAPITRAKWHWIVFLQGLAVCVPLGWLLGWPITFVGLAAFATTLMLVSLHWWLRYRSMQKTWARARLVAETARSLIATYRHPAAWPWRVLATVPSLRPLRWARGSMLMNEPFSKWLNSYIENRIAVQERYFGDKQKEAERQRKNLTWWTTLLLDLALLFALAGLIIVFTPRGEAWMVGGSFAQAVLGSTSILILLGLLLIQVVRELQEVDRRTARFAQQRLVLRDAKTRLSRVHSQELTLEVIADTESKLLTEVLEWYFHAETAERFIELREPTKRALAAKFLKQSSSTRKIARAVPANVGKAGLFVLGVIVGRLPWVVVSAAAVVMWIYYWLPEHGADFKKLEDSVQLFREDDQRLLNPILEKTQNGRLVSVLGAQKDLARRANNGYVVLVHGLYGRGLLTGESKEDQRNWMKPCAELIEERMAGDGEPVICLVNWSEAAMPSNFYHGVFGERSLLADIPAIRSQAYRVGDIVAFRLAGIILQNNLPRNVPFHFIGHSAGGFVVARLARRLIELGVAEKSCVHVTILDTPAPDDEITKVLPEFLPRGAVDFYISSDIGGRLPTLRSAPFSPNIHVYPVPAENEPPRKRKGVFGRVIGWVGDLYSRGSSMWKAHRHSYEWFMETIKDPASYPHEGFNRSSLLR